MRTTLAVLAAALLCVAPLTAHHGWTLDYDSGKPVSVKGIVTKIEWTNPHIHFYVDSTDDKGTVTSWNFEMASPNVLVRNGWKRTSLKIGDEVTVTGYLARTGPPAGPKMAIAENLTASDGRKMFASSATDLSR